MQWIDARKCLAGLETKWLLLQRTAIGIDVDIDNLESVKLMFYCLSLGQFYAEFTVWKGKIILNFGDKF